MFVSVIIPTYNRSVTIKRSIESVLNQTHKELEVIVIDDGSNDDTATIIDTIKDDRLRYIQLPKNQGVSNARNLGVNYSKYNTIAFQDSDDEWRKDKLEKQIRMSEEHPDSAMVYCAYKFHDPTGAYQVPPIDFDQEKAAGDICKHLLSNNTIGAPTILIKKALFDKLNGFDDSYEALEDWDFVIRASKAGRISYVNEALVDVYPSNNSLSLSATAFFKSRCKMIAEYMNDLQNYGIFDLTVCNLFDIAQKRGALEHVKKLLMLSLAEKNGML